MDINRIYKKSSESQVRNFYEKYKNVFKSFAMDYEDVRDEIILKFTEKIYKAQFAQEKVHATLLDDIRDGKPFDETKAIKYFSRLTKHSLNDLLNCNLKDDIINDIYDFAEDTSKEPLEILEDLKNGISPNKTKKPVGREKITELEYRILYKKFIEEKTEAQIAQEEGMGKGKLRYAYVMIIKYHSRNKRRYLNTVGFSDILKDDFRDDSNKDEFEACYDAGMLDVEPTMIDSGSILFSQIKELVTDFEYQIIEARFIKDLSIKEIAEEFSIDVDIMGKLYKKIEDKLKKVVRF